MRTGDEIRFYRHGLRITPQQASHIGLLDGGTAWGMWIGDGAHFSDPEDSDFNPTQQGPHLVVSPIHPDRWPAVFMINVRIQRAPGTMRTLAARLRHNGINIINIKVADAGFMLSRVSMICEHPALSQRVKHRLDKLGADFHDPEFTDNQKTQEEQKVNHRKLRTSCMKECGLDQLSLNTWLAADLRMFDIQLRSESERQDAIQNCMHVSSNDSVSIPNGFLHRRTCLLGLNSWYLESNDLNDITSLSQRAYNIGLYEQPDDPDGVPQLQSHLIKYMNEVKSDDLLLIAKGKFGVNTIESHRRLIEKLEDPDTSCEKIIREAWRKGGYDPIEILPLGSLAYARIWALPDAQPVALKYNLQSHLLGPISDRSEDTLEQHGSIQRRSSKLMKDLFTFGNPKHASDLDETATGLSFIHPSEQYLRVRVLRGKFARTYAYQLDIDYLWKKSDDKDTPAGFLEHVLRALHRNNMNVERVENSLSYQSLIRERGFLRIVMIKSIKSESESENSCKKIENDTKNVLKGAKRKKWIRKVKIKGVVCTSLQDAIDERSVFA